MCRGRPWVWSLGLFGPIFSPYLINKKKLIKKEYCRLSVSPHSLQVTPSRARPPLVKGGQANWHPSLGLWGSAESPGTQASIALRGVPSHWRPSLVASLHSEGPSHDWTAAIPGTTV